MILTPLELQSSTWIKLSSHFRERLDQLRGQNDGDLGEVDTARLRGRILMLRELLEIGNLAIEVSDE